MEVALDMLTDEQFAGLVADQLQGLIEAHRVAVKKFQAQTPEGAEPDPERLLLARIANSQIVLLTWVFRQAKTDQSPEQKPEEKNLITVPFPVMNGARHFRRG